MNPIDIKQIISDLLIIALPIRIIQIYYQAANWRGSIRYAQIERNLDKTSLDFLEKMI